MIIRSFIGGSYTAKSPIVNCERTINLMVEALPPAAAAARTERSLSLRPGVDVFAEPTIAGAGRAAFAENDRQFVIIGGTLYDIAENGTATSRGTVAVDGNPATICSNGDGGGQLGITSGGNFYCYDLSTDTLTQVSALDGKATMGDMLDGYFLVLDAATSTLYISDLLDGTTFDPTQFAQRSLAGDPWRAMLVSRSQRIIRLFGEATTEDWYNAGGFPFPFAARPDSLMPFGIAAPFSAENVGAVMMWLSQNKSGKGQVILAAGLEPRIVSTPPQQIVFEALAQPSLEAYVGETFEIGGHVFYLLTTPAAETSHVYDLTTGLWVEWGTWISEEAMYTAWRPLYHMLAFGKHLMVDRSAARIYEVSTAFYTDVDDRPIRWLRKAPLPWGADERVFCSGVSLLLEPGLGPMEVEETDPDVPSARVAMRFSWNGGKTWGPERTCSAGYGGDYHARVSFNRCGSGYKPAIEFVGTEAAPWHILGLDAALSAGAGVAT